MAFKGQLIMVTGLAAGFGVALLWQQWSQPPAPAVAVAQALTVEPGCAPTQEVCTARGDGVQLGFQFSGPVKGLQAVGVELVTTVEPVEVVVDFAMAGMDMGRNRYRLIKEKGAWRGRVTLPVCTTNRTDWLATVELATGEQRWQAVFPFEMTP